MKKRVLDHLRYRYEHMKIKNRTLLGVAVLVVLCMLFFMVGFSAVFRSKVSKDNLTYANKIIQNTISYLDSYIDEISAIANDSNYNYYLQNYLIDETNSDSEYSSLSSGKRMQDYEMSSKLFSNAINSRTDVTSIMIFGKKKILLYKTMYSYMYTVVKYSDYPWYQRAADNPKESIVTGPQTHTFLIGNTDKTISLSRVISSYEDGSFLGVILIDLNLNRVSEICEGVYHDKSGKLCILNAEGEMVYEQRSAVKNMCSLKSENVLSELNRGIKSSKKNSFNVYLEGAKYQVVYEKMEKTGWYVVSITPYSEVATSIHHSLTWILIVFIVTLIIIMIGLNSIVSKSIDPILVLKKYMDQADSGNLDQKMKVYREDEIGMLAISFNHMLDRIQNLKEQVTEEQESKRKYELQALQAQINPHFLYNTLDSIIWLAEIQDKNVVPMTEALAKLFRISLNHGKEFIRIPDELEHVRNYLFIQSMRYTNKFDYEITWSNDVKYCKTIKLIIQPLVENSIYHGIKQKKGKGKIQVTAYRKEEEVFIQVSDDGAGMSQELCERILDSSYISESNMNIGIGVRNVNERIKLYFGEKYGLSYVSEEGKGTTVLVSLPVMEDTIG